MSHMNKQLVSFVLDNSVSVSKEKLSALMNGFRRLCTAKEQYPFLEWELLTFDTFAPDVAKSFAQEEIRPVRAGRRYSALSRTLFKKPQCQNQF